MIATEGTTEAGGRLRSLLSTWSTPRSAAGEGEPLFLEFGGNTDYLDRLAAILEGIHGGHTTTPQFVDAMEHGLSPYSLKITLQTGQDHALEGFAIDDEKLQRLNEDAVTDLHRRGHLLPAYMMVFDHN